MPCWILGVSALYHDSAAVLLRDGQIVAAAQEERFSRIKNDPSLPLRATRWLLEQAGITIADVEHLVFYEKPLRKFERILVTSVVYSPRSWRLFPLQMKAWLGDKLWIRDQLASSFGVAADRLLFCEHHLSHAASAFFCSPHEEAAILTIDGVGEWATTSLWKGSGNWIEAISEIRYPHSLGLFYSAVTAHLGFIVNNGEYKVMGMASYGQPRFVEVMEDMLIQEEGGSFRLNLEYFCHHLHPRRATTPRFEEALGTPRHPTAEFDVDSEDPEIKRQSQLYADIAASAQTLLERLLVALAEHAHETTGSSALCLAGGVALNAVANQKMAEQSSFQHVWAQPAAGDAGGAIGAALWAWHMVLERERSPGFFRFDLGKSWSAESVARYLQDFQLEWSDAGEDLAAQAAQDLSDGKIIGWMQGGFEWGPRALGQRSLLADPRPADMKDRLNRSVKFREPFRPFAPMALKEHADDWFAIPEPSRGMLDYMVCTVDVRPEKQAQIAAVTHTDGTARLQTVRAEHSPLMASVLGEFHKLTGVPVLVNTSFNVKGDPIINSPVDAVATFLQSDIDLLYIGRFRVEQPKRRRLYSNQE